MTTRHAVCVCARAVARFVLAPGSRCRGRTAQWGRLPAPAGQLEGSPRENLQKLWGGGGG